MQVTHASVGITDAMAVRGDYVLHPLPGFVPGYDVVGTIQSLPAGTDTGFAVGQRVTGILPRMGAHATLVAIDPSLLVPVPDGLDSATAATLPLDAVTASLALRALSPDRGAVLVQGAGGAVGAWAVQIARAAGRTVYGTASTRSGPLAEHLGATVVDYRDPTWIDRVIAASGGGVAGVIDHTGDRSIRRAVRGDGRIVRIAFGGVPGRQRAAAARGALLTGLHRFARPSERIVSVPVSVAVHRAGYRQILGEVLRRVSTGELTAPRPQVFPLRDYRSALSAAAAGEPGVKAVLASDD
ncbi:zinc-binding dehydrogenase [Raineyella sp. LH-20]|uniref:zinc-binding dehydrogenase n=1 Tax=Raineyella sp. LH-20 TaxID=3081204 RepID=UPI0029552F41|nr:zinc-binding dehydrogenase [Raineyella sp. LH-20]WOP17709.1 zinc-binding dehydrogenase [Raineyella sp. LH-20]